jgi:hypothetical protein
MALYSCTDPDLIGLEIQPDGDKITLTSFDQNPPFTLSSVAGDSIRTDETLLSLLGFYQSSPFGNAKAEFSTQLLLADNNVDFGSTPVVDSAFIYLVYADYYGDTNVSITINIEELLEDIVLEDTFYSTQVLNSANFSSPIELSFSPRPNTIDIGDTTVLSPRLKLDVKDIAQKIVDAPSSSLTNNTAFLDFFKGLSFRISSNPSSASISYFDLRNSESIFRIHYNGSQTYDLSFGNSAARVNHFEVENVGPFNFTGVQSMGGPVLKVTFDDLQSLKDTLENKPINKAILTFNVADNFPNLFGPHPSLSLVRKNNEGIYLFIPDYYEGITHYGGLLEGNTYSFNISKYLLHLMYGDFDDNAIYLLPAGNAISANRTLFDDELTLTITYTNF